MTIAFNTLDSKLASGNYTYPSDNTGVNPWQPQPQPWYPGPAPAQPWVPDTSTTAQVIITSSDPEGLSKEEFDQLKLRFSELQDLLLNLFKSEDINQAVFFRLAEEIRKIEKVLLKVSENG